MRRRKFITGLGGAAAWGARSKGEEPSWRFELLRQSWVSVHLGCVSGGVGEFGWVEGRNLRIDYRFVVCEMVSLTPATGEALAAASYVQVSGQRPRRT
jgi:hypothetical protein